MEIFTGHPEGAEKWSDSVLQRSDSPAAEVSFAERMQAIDLRGWVYWVNGDMRRAADMFARESELAERQSMAHFKRTSLRHFALSACWFRTDLWDLKPINTAMTANLDYPIGEAQVHIAQSIEATRLGRWVEADQSASIADGLLVVASDHSDRWMPMLANAFRHASQGSAADLAESLELLTAHAARFGVGQFAVAAVRNWLSRLEDPPASALADSWSLLLEL